MRSADAMVPWSSPPFYMYLAFACLLVGRYQSPVLIASKYGASSCILFNEVRLLC